MSKNTRIVMIGTTHPGNIGAAARAMKTMCLEKLVLVAPETDFPHPDATARASGADDILQQAGVFDDLDAALAECQLIIGASARLRSLDWPLLEPTEMADKVIAAGDETRVAILFGREHSGLTNDELSRCHYLVNIPTNPEYGSLNIAAAVQVLSWELRKASGARVEREASDNPLDQLADGESLDGLFRHLEQTLVDIDFLDPANPGHMMQRLRRLFLRSQLDNREIKILRGILSSVDRVKGGS